MARITSGYKVSPLGLRLEAKSLESEARALIQRAGALADTADRLECPGCVVQVGIPADRSGALVLSRAYATHELTCTA